MTAPPAASGSPSFAVVGHPNKGKSSIVATLAQDDSIRIAAESGTTTEARAFPMSIDGRTLFTLIDTPGFQRARAALGWMREHETTVAEHPAVVAAFVAAHRTDPKHRDEVELLRPIVDGAGVLYVVDGSTPVGTEYEAEMEILRWAGRPSMALINPIGEADHIDEWRNALGQYFKVVRVFDVMTAEFDKRLELLRAFGQLDEDWRAPLAEAVDALLTEREQRRQRAARSVAELLVETISHRESKKLSSEADPAPHREPLEKRYKDALRAAEKRCRQRVEETYNHLRLRRDEDDLDVLDADLFSQRAWLAFGLRRRDLVTLGAVGGGVSGAVAGGMIDAAGAGTTFFTGAATGFSIGFLGGGAAAWWGADRMTHLKVMQQPLGGKELVCGPNRNANFPFVVLNRARLHHQLVANRTHAERSTLHLSPESAALDLSPADRKRFADLFARVRKADRDADRLGDLTDELTDLADEVLESDLKP